MGTQINTDIKLFNSSNTSNSEKTDSFDFSSVNIGDIMLNGTETEKKRLLSLMEKEGVSPLRAYLTYVKAHNEPIKEEIAYYRNEIHNSRRELSSLKQQYKSCDDEEQQLALKEMISGTKKNIWDMCRANVRRAFSLA